MRCMCCGRVVERQSVRWGPALLAGAGGSLGFGVMGFFYPPLWFGVALCLTLGLVLGFFRTPLCSLCR
jgi:hypothetical protein